MEELMESMAGMAPLLREEWKRVLGSDPVAAVRVHNLLLQLATINHVMSKVTIEG